MSKSLTWITSTYSASGNCVAVAADDHVLVQDTKNVQGPVLRFSAANWRAFTAQVKAARCA